MQAHHMKHLENLQTKCVLLLLFWVKNFFKMFSLFAVFASAEGKQLLSRLLYM